MKTVDIVGVPLDLGSGRRGVDMGPSAFRIAGVSRRIRDLGYSVNDCGDIRVPIPEVIGVRDSRARFAGEIAEACESLFVQVRDSILEGHLPLTLGGDHSLAVGSVTGTAEAMRSLNRPYGLLWVDAHADMNTPESSPSGNVHGMPLACLLGKGPKELVELGGFQPKLDPKRCVLVGIRNLDERERDIVRHFGVQAFTMKDIDRRGIASITEEAVELICSDGASLHVSFDMDAVDPTISPGVGTPVRGGLSYRESHLLMEIVADTKKLIALDVVEVNPILDTQNVTAGVGIEFILSALGKNIL